MANKTVYVDNTLLAAVACSTRVLLRHHHGLASDGPHSRAKLLAGTAGHAALETWLHGADARAALAVFEREYRPWSDENLAMDSAVAWEHVSDVLAAWFARHKRERLPLTIAPENIEVGFQLPLADECTCGHPSRAHVGATCTANGYRTDRDSVSVCACQIYVPAYVFCGRLDAWGTTPNGEIYVLDHKLTGWLDEDYMGSYRLNSQMRGYVWALRETLGRPVAGFFVNGIQAFRKLPSNLDYKCSKHQVKYRECRTEHLVAEIRRFRVTAAELDQWRADALALARRFVTLRKRYPALADIARAPMEGTFARGCKWCEFAAFCEDGRPVQWANSMLRHDPWRPFPLSQDAASAALKE